MAEYLFSSQDRDKEYERLCLIQDSFDEKTKKYLLKSGLKEGMDCLEVGIGAGSIALWMKEQVGRDGSVFGVDLDTSYVDDKELRLIQGDILKVDIKQTFDLIHVRYVLIHNKDSQAILTKLKSLLKPHGKLVIEEPDFTLAKWIEAVDIEACKRVNSALCKMFEQRSLKAHYGSIVHLSLQELGFEIEENHSYLHLCSGREEVARVMAYSTKALAQMCLDTKLCSEDDIVKYISACDDKESLAVYYATIVVTASKGEDSTVLLGLDRSLRKDGFYVAKSDEEINECFSLMSLLRPHYNQESFLLQVKEQIADGYTLVYLYSGDTLVSLAGYRIVSNLAWGRYLYVEDLVSLEVQRSQGYGKKMIAHLIEIAKQEGCVQIHLDSGVQRFKAHKFYLREGFKIASHHFSMLL